MGSAIDLDSHGNKDDIRRRARTRRRKLHADQGDLAIHIKDAFINYLRGRASANLPHQVAGYWPMGSEVSDLDLLHQLAKDGVRLHLPVVVGAHTSLAFIPWHPETEMIEGPHGAHVPRHTPQDRNQNYMPDIILVPFLAFDTQGHRMGQGGGYYDRTLASWRRRGEFLAIGLAFEGQKVDVLPRHDHDQMLDVVVTEERIYEFERGAE